MASNKGEAMLDEALAGLASAGGTALVSAMVTDGWENIKTQFARLLGHGDGREAAAAAARLAESRALLTAAGGAQLQGTRAEQEIAWRTRLADLLERQPDLEVGLRDLVANVQAQLTDSAPRVEQHVTGSGQAQQAVQGHGIQVNTFGGQGESAIGQ
jgi:hypothetical protein